MLEITTNIIIPENELEMSFIRSPGPGGQNVNKVATAVLLRFNVRLSSAFTLETKERILHLLQPRLTNEGEIIIKASNHRTQEQNKREALQRLTQLLRSVVKPPKKRHKTKPTFASKQKRLASKKIRGKHKAMRNFRGQDDS